jgi:hypothetical protein
MDTQEHQMEYWRFRHCKRLTKKVLWSQGKWALCIPCYSVAYHRKGEQS